MGVSLTYLAFFLTYTSQFSRTNSEISIMDDSTEKPGEIATEESEELFFEERRPHVVRESAYGTNSKGYKSGGTDKNTGSNQGQFSSSINSFDDKMRLSKNSQN